MMETKINHFQKKRRKWTKRLILVFFIILPIGLYVISFILIVTFGLSLDMKSARYSFNRPRGSLEIPNTGLVDSLPPYSEMKSRIKENDLLDVTLHVVLSVFNPAYYASRYVLTHDFIKRIEKYDQKHVRLYIVELAYGDQPFILTQPGHARHLRLRTGMPMWHKENLLNLGVEKLLPKDWKALAWVDGEIEFESPTWASDTLILLNGCYDMVQLFSHGLDLDEHSNTAPIHTGFGYNFLRGINYQKEGIDLWHPGYAWACTRRAYDQIGGFFEGNILGGGDQSTAYSLIGMHATLSSDNVKLFPSAGYRDAILKWEKRFDGLKVGYVPGVVKHHYHGAMSSRRYWDRRDILSDVAFDPHRHIMRDKMNGVLIPTPLFPKKLAGDIADYFRSRQEDDSAAQRTQGAGTDLIRDAIISNHPLDERLYVIVLLSPPVFSMTNQEKQTYNALTGKFLASLGEDEISSPAQYYLVELSYDGTFLHTQQTCSKHLQLQLSTPIWSKGNIINLAIKKLLPENWEAVAYIDIGVELESLTWASDALKLLRSYDVLQLFSHAVQVDIWGNTTWMSSSFGYCEALSPNDGSASTGHCYPGYGWVYSRGAYDRSGIGLFEGDLISSDCSEKMQAWSLVDYHSKLLPFKLSQDCPYTSEGYYQAISEYESSLTRDGPIKVAYVPGVARQFQLLSFDHGNKRISDIGVFLKKLKFDPREHLMRGENGILYPSFPLVQLLTAFYTNSTKEGF